MASGMILLRLLTKVGVGSSLTGDVAGEWPLMNFAPFYKAFNAPAGEKNYKSENERIKIW